MGRVPEVAVLGWARQLLGQEQVLLGDGRGARRWLSQLPTGDAMKALQELTRGLHEVSELTGQRLLDRLEVIELLDEASIGNRNRLAREYLSQVRLPSYRENALWFAIHQYWAALAAAYNGALDQAQADKSVRLQPEQLLRFILRGLHAGRHHLKWRRLRYSLVEPAQWRSVARFLVVAENNQMGTRSMPVYAGLPTDSTPQNELLKLLLLGVSATDALMPVQTEIASRLIDATVGQCQWSTQPSAELPFCFDLAGERPPMRIQGAPLHPGLWRFFSGQPALEALERFRADAERGVISSGLHLGGDYPCTYVAGVAEHLQRYWVHPPPERRAERLTMYQRINVIHGFSQVVRHFIEQDEQASEPAADEVDDEVIELQSLENGESAADSGDALYTSSLDGARHPESWLVQNVSVTGMGAVIPRVSGDWLQVGQLLALAFVEPASAWKLAVVRRLHQTSQGQVYVGLEILGRQVQAVRICLEGALAQDEEYGLVLDHAGGNELKLLTRVGLLGPQNKAQLDYQGRAVVRTRCCLEKNASFDLALVTRTPGDALEKPC